jgi:hypothetical protein
MRAPTGSSAPSDVAPGAASATDPRAFWHLADDFRPYLKVVAARLLGPSLGGKADPSDIVPQGLLEPSHAGPSWPGEC